jgi:ETC complex I subunit conserved region
MSLRVRIYQPAKSTMQSGRSKSHVWSVEPELLTARIPDALMGWASAGDTLGELKNRLLFDTKDEAVAFAEKQGWEYMVAQPAQRTIVPKNYLDNFKWKRAQDEA